MIITNKKDMKDYKFATIAELHEKSIEDDKKRVARAIMAFNDVDLKSEDAIDIGSDKIMRKYLSKCTPITEHLQSEGDEEIKEKHFYDQQELLKLVTDKYGQKSYKRHTVCPRTILKLSVFDKLRNARAGMLVTNEKPPFTVKYTWYHNLRYLIFKFKMLFLG